MSIEAMKNEVIYKFGLEHVLTIDFFRICEEGDNQKIWDTYLTYLYIEG